MLRRSALRLTAVGMLAGLTACGATDEINFIAGDNTMSFAQDETGRYTRTDASVLGDLSAVLPEGVVPVSGVRPASGELAAVPTSTTAQTDNNGGGGGFGFGNFTFRTARSAELEALRYGPSGRPPQRAVKHQGRPTKARAASAFSAASSVWATIWRPRPLALINRCWARTACRLPVSLRSSRRPGAA